MKKKILVPVKVSERLPAKEDIYFTKDSDNYINIHRFNGRAFIRENFDYDIEYWYEEIEVEEGESKNILPNNNRLTKEKVKEINKVYNTALNESSYLLLQYHKAIVDVDIDSILNAKLKID